MYWLVAENVVTRGLQESNFVFPRGRKNGSVFTNLVFVVPL